MKLTKHTGSNGWAMVLVFSVSLFLFGLGESFAGLTVGAPAKPAENLKEKNQALQLLSSKVFLPEVLMESEPNVNNISTSFTAATSLLRAASDSAVFSRAPGLTSAPNGNDAKGTVSNVWVDTPVSQMIRDISMQTHVTIVMDPTVRDTVLSLEVNEMPLEDCLKQIVMGQGLVLKKVNEQLYLIGNGTPDSPTFQQMASAQTLPLKYITAKAFFEILPREYLPYVSKSEGGTNIMIFAPPEKLECIKKLYDQIDVARQQVMLEVLVVEISKDGAKQFSIDWERAGQDSLISLLNGPGGFIANYASIPQRDFRSLMLNLNMLVSNGKAVVRSRPRVATTNGESATIDMSNEEYFNIATDVNGAYIRSQLQVVKSGVTLKMLPQIGAEGDITVQVDTEVSDVGARHDSSAGALPIIRRRKAVTKVRVKDGDAIVIGGLIESQERSNIRRVPILGSIPVLGLLFQKRESETVEKEFIIFITPTIVKEGQNAQTTGMHQLIDSHKEVDSLHKQK